MSQCLSCRKPAHNFATEEAFSCVPPPSVLQFGSHIIDVEYRAALYAEYPFYTAEEVVGSFLGHNPHFPSQPEFWDKQLDALSDWSDDQAMAVDAYVDSDSA